MRVKATVEVTRIIDGYGFKGVEKKKTKDGKDINVWVTVWTKEQVREGETLEVSGDLSVKIESFTGRDNQPKQVAAININNPGLAIITVATLFTNAVPTTGAESNHKNPLIKSCAAWQVSSIQV